MVIEIVLSRLYNYVVILMCMIYVFNVHSTLRLCFLVYFLLFDFFFFFKQKTAYEMRISDWSSDVCSSDLAAGWRAAACGGRRHLTQSLPQDKSRGGSASPDDVNPV